MESNSSAVNERPLATDWGEKAPKEGSPERPWEVTSPLLILTVLVGVLARVILFAHAPSLWLDEASLSLNILGRSFSGLTHVLDYEQGAPVLYLWKVAKMATLAFGSGERALRLESFVTGTAALVLFTFVARRLLSRVAAVMIVTLFALSPSLCRYSNEAKQYSTDVFTCVLLLLVALRFEDARTRQRQWALAVIGVFAVFLSHPAVFVLAGIGSVELYRSAKDDSSRRKIMPVLAGWTIAVALNYTFFLRHLTASTYLLQYWDTRHAAFSLNPIHAFREMIVVSGVQPWQSLAILSSIGVLLILWRRGVEFMILSPLPFVLAASWLRKYPLANRMCLFIVPIAFLAAGVALDWLLARRMYVPALIGVVVLWSYPAKQFAALVMYPERFIVENVRNTLALALRDSRCSGPIYMVDRSTYEYYERYKNIDPEHRVVTEIPSAPCFWVVHGHFPLPKVTGFARTQVGRNLTLWRK